MPADPRGQNWPPPPDILADIEANSIPSNDLLLLLAPPPYSTQGGQITFCRLCILSTPLLLLDLEYSTYIEMLLNLQHPNLLKQFTWLKLEVSFVYKTIWKKKYPTESIWNLAKHIKNKKLFQQKRHTHFEFEIQKIIILLEIYCLNGLTSILKENPYFYFIF